MTDLTINSKPKYGTGRFIQKTSSLLDSKTSLTFDKYSNLLLVMIQRVFLKGSQIQYRLIAHIQQNLQSHNVKESLIRLEN